VILPSRNEKSVLEDVPKAVREQMTFKLADSVEQVIAAALEPAPTLTTAVEIVGN
jgi:ATP-dependent Lon protease